jgi:hypothetical protein
MGYGVIAFELFTDIYLSSHSIFKVFAWKLEKPNSGKYVEISISEINENDCRFLEIQIEELIKLDHHEQ